MRTLMAGRAIKVLTMTTALLGTAAAPAIAQSVARSYQPAARGPAQATATCGKANGALHVRGVRVYDASGKQFISYGVTMSGLAGYNYASLLNSDEKAIAASATSWCANTVRLQIAQDLLVGPHASQAFQNAVRDEVKVAEQNGLVVALNAQTESVGGELAPTAATIAFWQYMIKLYGKDKKVIFDVFNEPRAISSTCGTSSDWQLWQHGGVYKGTRYLGEQDLVSTIRKTDTTNLIWVENICGSLNGVQKYPVTGTDVVYSIHHPWGTHTPATWDSDFGFLLEKNIAPVVDGEWTNYSSTGPECWADAPTAVPAYLAWLTQHGIGLSGWTLVKNFLIESDNPADPTYIRSTWRCVSGLDQGAGALLMAWFKRQNTI